MKIFTTQEIREIDRRTIEDEGVDPMELIERVAEGVTFEIVSRWRPGKPLVVFAGPGNNGADALAVARQLLEQGYSPEVYLFNIGGNRLSAQCAESRARLLASTTDFYFNEIIDKFTLPNLSPGHLVIDGLFGTGLRDSLNGGFKTLVQYINDSGATVVSIDVPSGMTGDWNTGAINRNIIHASLTIAIQFPRLAFFLADNAELVGEWKVIDIGLSEKAIAEIPARFHLVERREIHNSLKHRSPFSSKADYGSAMIIAGSYGMMGAAVLAARGALRSGAGKVTVQAPKCGYNIIQTAVPDAMYQYNTGDINLAEIKLGVDFDAVAIGPGISTADVTVKAVEDFLSARNKPIIIDADALNCIARKPAILNLIPVLSIITPHPGEFDRLFGPQPSDEARLRKAIEVAQYYKIFVILKGHHTAIIRPDGKVYFNSSGTPAMATGGSGDVLTGILVSLTAQGYRPEISSLIAVYVHGVAGEIAARDHGEYGVTATDIAASTGRAIMNVMNLLTNNA